MEESPRSDRTRTAMGQGGARSRTRAAGGLARRQAAAPLGCIPKPGESWLPIGRKALVGAAYLAPVDLVRPLVPEEFDIVSVWPGRTLATAFVADYGPGST